MPLTPESLANRMLRRREEDQRGYVLMLGAGASMSSGVPSTPTIMTEIVAKFDHGGTGKLEQRFNKLWANSSDLERRVYLKPYLEHEPSVGYRRLAEIIREQFFQVVVTFNFDDLLERALLEAGVGADRYVRIVRGETSDDAMQRLVDANDGKLKIVKLHGSIASADYFLFDAGEMNSYPQKVASLVRDLTSRDIVVCGYAFNDACVIKAFSEHGGSVVCVDPGGVPNHLAGVMKGRRSEDHESRETFDAFFVALHEHLLPRGQRIGPRPRTPPNPFKFLEAYDEDDAPAFRYREREIEDFFRCLDRRAPHVIALVGPGRAGKSSLVRAGLIPKLNQGLPPGAPRRGVYVRCPLDETHPMYDGRANPPRPRHPAACLVAELAQREGVDPAATLADAYRQLSGRSTDRTVLFIDQFERAGVKFGRTREDVEALVKLYAELLPPADAKRLTVVFVLSDAERTTALRSACDSQDLVDATLGCLAFSKDGIIRIVNEMASEAGFEFDPQIVRDLARLYESTRVVTDADRRFTLAHIHAICHLLAREPKVTYESYRALFDSAALSELHDAINVSEYPSFTEDENYPVSAWLRSLVKLPLRTNNKVRIAWYVTRNYDDVVPQRPARTAG